MEKLRSLTKKQLLVLAVTTGFMLGILSFVGYRMARVQAEEEVHYHADFAVYINGQQEKFDSFTYYEEVQTCDVHDEDDVKGRAHMHGNVNHVIHVHAHAVTWGHFFANIGYAVGDNVISNEKQTFVTDPSGNKVEFILNGERVSSIANRLIKSEDSLLISYGNEDEATIMQRFDGMTRGAEAANNSSDPASCGGNEQLTFVKRLRVALGLDEQH